VRTTGDMVMGMDRTVMVMVTTARKAMGMVMGTTAMGRWARRIRKIRRKVRRRARARGNPPSKEI